MVTLYLDLKTVHTQQIVEQIVTKFKMIIETNNFVSGDFVKQFESAFATYCESKYCVAVNSGTSALILALLSCGLSKGDKVAVPANTFVATASAVAHAGGIPVFIDVEEDTALLSIDKLGEVIKQQDIKFVIPVHLYGFPFPTLELTKRFPNIIVVEDAAQAHGLSTVGEFSSAAIFSFYPGKNLGAMGEGGAVITSNIIVAEKVQMLRDHGSKEKYKHCLLGFNERMDSFQGAVLLTKLPYLNENNLLRKKVAFKYIQELSNVVKTPCPSDTAVWHVFAIRTEQRDDLKKYLDACGIQTNIHYPIPLHLQECFSYLGYKKADFPISEKIADELLSLPIYPDLNPDPVISAIKEYYHA